MNLIVGSYQCLARKMRSTSCQSHKVALIPAVDHEASRTEVSALPLFRNSRVTAKHWHERAPVLHNLLPLSPSALLDYNPTSVVKLYHFEGAKLKSQNGVLPSRYEREEHTTTKRNRRKHKKIFWNKHGSVDMMLEPGL